MTTKTQKRLEKEVVNKCNWCGLKIGTNEFRCLKCQGYKLAKENFKKLIDDFREPHQDEHHKDFLKEIKEALKEL